MYLQQGGAHIHVRDVGEIAHQRVVETLNHRGLERTHKCDRHVGHRADRVDRIKIRPHRAPVDLAQRSDFCVYRHTANIKPQGVAELQVQRGGDAFFHTDGSCLLIGPTPGYHRVVLRLGGTVRQVELAVNHAFGAVVGKVVGRHRFAVHRHQPTPDHGEPVVVFHARLTQVFLESFALLRHDVDDKTVRRVGRCGLAPAADEVGAQQYEQHQREQPHRQCTHLHHSVGRARGNLARGQHQPARRSRFADAAPKQLDGQPAQRRKQQHRASEPAHRNQAQHHVAAGCQQQSGKPSHTNTQHRQRSGFEVTHVAPDHPQRWHLGQLQYRWQTKRKQQCQPHSQTKRHRPQAGGRQGGIDQPGQQQHKYIMHPVTNRHAQRAG